MGENVTQIVRFTHISSRKRVLMCVHNSIMTRVKFEYTYYLRFFEFEFSLDLARMIGFKAGTISSEKPLDLASNSNSFYVYCN